MGRRHIVRNGLLIGVVALGGLSLAWPDRPPEPAGAGLAIAVGLSGAVVVVFFDEIVELFLGPSVGRRPAEKGRA